MILYEIFSINLEDNLFFKFNFKNGPSDFLKQKKVWRIFNFKLKFEVEWRKILRYRTTFDYIVKEI